MAATAAVLVVAAPAQTTVAAPAASIVVFPLPTPSAAPTRIALGPDGAMWFTEDAGNKIGRITFGGAITEFTLPTPYSGPHGITIGPDGNIWFAEMSASKIGRMTPDGQLTEFAVPDYGCPQNITAGPDGNLWFTECSRDYIGRMTPDGQLTGFHTAGDGFSAPYDITTGPDGHLWFTEPGGHYADWVGEMTTDGAQVGAYGARGDCVNRGCWPRGITVGSDGNLWIANSTGRDVWGVTPDGEYVNANPYRTPFSPGYVTTGPGRRLWIAGYLDDAKGLALMTLDGRLNLFPPLPPGPPTDVEVGPGGHSLWVTSSSGNAIVRITSGG